MSPRGQWHACRDVPKSLLLFSADGERLGMDGGSVVVAVADGENERVVVVVQERETDGGDTTDDIRRKAGLVDRGGDEAVR